MRSGLCAGSASAAGSAGTATVNFERNFRALSKGEDLHSIARQRKEKVARRIGVRGKEEGREN